jgi:hypothetical protein
MVYFPYGGTLPSTQVYFVYSQNNESLLAQSIFSSMRQKPKFLKILQQMNAQKKSHQVPMTPRTIEQEKNLSFVYLGSVPTVFPLRSQDVSIRFPKWSPPQVPNVFVPNSTSFSSHIFYFIVWTSS